MRSEETKQSARQAMLERAGEGALVPLYLIREPLGWPEQETDKSGA